MPAIMSTVEDDIVEDDIDVCCCFCCCCWRCCRAAWCCWCSCKGQVRSSSMYNASGIAHVCITRTCCIALLSWPRTVCSFSTAYMAAQHNEDKNSGHFNITHCQANMRNYWKKTTQEFITGNWLLSTVSYTVSRLSMHSRAITIHSG